MSRLNMRNTINKTKGKVNQHYDMRYSDLQDIANESNSMFDAIADSFRFGYAQGMKAAKAEMRKRGIA